MKRWEGFEHGMGIGGWLTNYKRFNCLPPERRLALTIGDWEHFRTFITREDVKYIRTLGMDHIRLGFDQIVIEEHPGVYRQEIDALLLDFVDWCAGEQMNVVLNLHKAIGNYCDIEEPIQLMDDAGLQARFVALWEHLEDLFHARPGVAFELLNEVRDVDPAQWNQLARKTIEAIRKKNPIRPIVVGGTKWNAPDALRDLEIFDDNHVIYTFHCYEPFSFTHQQGVLQPLTLYYNRKMPYPGDIEVYRDYERVVFGKEHAVPDQGNREVKYADKKEIQDGILEKYPPEWKEETPAPSNSDGGGQAQQDSPKNEPQRTSPKDKNRGGNPIRTSPPKKETAPDLTEAEIIKDLAETEVQSNEPS